MKSKNNKFRIEMNFDLSMKKLDEHYPGGRKKRRSAYREIKKYLKKKNFRHPLYSGYLSREFYDDLGVRIFINDFFDNIPWAEKCMKGCHITVVKDDIIDALYVRQLSKQLIEKDEELSFEDDLSVLDEEKMSLDDYIIHLEKKREMHLQKAEECSKKLIKLKNKTR